MATSTKQALQGSGVGWSYEAHCVTDLVTSASRDYAGSQGRIIGLQEMMGMQEGTGIPTDIPKDQSRDPYHLSTINGIRNGIRYHLSTLDGIQNGRKAEDI